MIGEYATQIHPLVPTKKSDDAYLFIFAGTNDLYYGNNASTIYSNLITEWDNAKADGFKVIAFTIPPRSGVYILNSSQEGNRTVLNNLIIDNSSLYDYLVRPDLLFPDSTNLTYYSDGLHLTEYASNLLADYIAHNFFSNPYNILNYKNGNIGMGTDNPDTAFQITAPGDINNGILKLRMADGEPFDYVGISFWVKKNSPHVGSLNWMISTNYNKFGELNFLRSIDNISAPTISSMVITGNGSVGIGTLVPSQKLEVNGSINISNGGNISIGGVAQLTRFLGTLPTCGVLYNNSLATNNSGLYYCNSTQSWTLIVAG